MKNITLKQMLEMGTGSVTHKMYNQEVYDKLRRPKENYEAGFVQKGTPDRYMKRPSRNSGLLDEKNTRPHITKEEAKLPKGVPNF